MGHEYLRTIPCMGCVMFILYLFLLTSISISHASSFRPRLHTSLKYEKTRASISESESEIPHFNSREFSLNRSLGQSETNTNSNKNTNSELIQLDIDKLDLDSSSSIKKVSKLQELYSKVRESRKVCKLKRSKSFYCQRVRWSWWLVKQMEKNTTVLNDFIELVPRDDGKSDDIFLEDKASQILPEPEPGSWLENKVYKFINDWGSASDKLVFFNLKKYAKSRELKVKFPSIDTSIKIGPLTSKHSSTETGRIFFDPGFNLKLKLPFVGDELKFAVSTGPSFIAGLGIGMVMLGIKSIFSPIVIGLGTMLMRFFFRDTSPFDLLRVFDFGTASPDETVEEIQNIEVYDPPPVHNPYDNVLDKHSPTAGSNLFSNNNAGYTSYRHNNENKPQHQYQHQHQTQNQNQYKIPVRQNPLVPYAVGGVMTAPTAPAIQQSSYSRPQGSTSASASTSTWANYRGNGIQIQMLPGRPTSSPSENYNSKNPGTGKDDQKKLVTSNKNTGTGYQYQYKPTATVAAPAPAPLLPMQLLEGEKSDLDFDPFYTPLLSRIDSIFMHMGFTDEGCKEKAVCSIYKSPGDYAPFSNLLSAQLSKHQSELKRPVSTSSKVVRYFKYMKAAKDGQGSMDCTELYPSCTDDTERLTNLRVVKTFQQLTDLSGSESN